MVDKINYNGEDRIAIILPDSYRAIEDGKEFGRSLFEAVETIGGCPQAKDLIGCNQFLDIIQLAQIASNLI